MVDQYTALHHSEKTAVYIVVKRDDNKEQQHIYINPSKSKHSVPRRNISKRDGMYVLPCMYIHSREKKKHCTGSKRGA